MENLVEVREVTKLFDLGGGVFGKKKYVKALEDVSFTIQKNEVVAVVGESGCGKSTLGRITLGLLKPTSGQVLYKDRDIWSMGRAEFNKFRRSAQIIHQDPYDTLNPMRTIFSTLSPPLQRYRIAVGKRAAWERASELLKNVGLEPPDDFLNRYPSRLSGGQMQRVSIARALSVKPDFIVADEAVSMLDASLRIEVLKLLLDLGREYDLSYLAISHDLATSRYFARGGKMMVMYLGKIMEMGNTERLFHNPLHPYTKMLLSVVPIPDPKVSRDRGLPKLKSLDVPSLTSLPSGCRYHTRCPYAKGICTEDEPKLAEIEGRLVGCHFAGELH